MMSISGPTSVEVGSTITLTSDRGGNYDKWSVSDDNKASITANANNSTSAVLTGKKAGNVTVTHSWYSRYLGYWYEQSETFDVTVTKKAMTRIYVYVKLNVAAGVSTSGWNINKDGWYTIGYVDVSSDSVPAADEKNLDRYYPEYSSAVQAALGNIHYYSGNQSVSQGIDLQGSNVNWSASGYGLKIASGASDYGNETGSTKQWHLDGLLTIKKIEKHNVTINYVYEDGSKAADSVIFKDVETGKSVSQTSPNIEGYTADQEKVTVTVLKDDVTVTVTYKKNYPKEKITIKAGSAEKVYDGTPLTEEKYTYTQGILLDGDVLTATTSGSRTEVGTSYNVIAGTAYSIKHGDKDVTSKYNVGLESGTLTVKPQSIVPENPDYKGIDIDIPSDSKYDGLEHKWSPTVKNAKGEKLTEGTDYEVSYDTDNFVDVKTITVTITGIGNYDGTVTRVYRITKAPLTIITKGATKVYDGEPLTEAKMTIKGLKNNEEVGHKTTGSQTVVGSSDNTYKLDWKEGTAKQGNYEIVKEQLGQLVVTETKDEIVVTTVGGEFTYDGKAHGASVTVEGLPKGYEVKTKKSNATATNVKDGTVKATADELVIVNKNGEDVTSKLAIKKVDGTIKINPASVTITTAGDEKVYDGTALTADGSITGLVNGEDKKVDFKVTGSQTEVGSSENSYTLDWKDVDSKNYNLKKNLGTLKVTEQSIDPGTEEEPNPSYKGITINDPKDKEYDGKKHQWSPTVKDASGNELTEGTDYEVSYDTNDFVDVKTIKVTITGKGNYAGTVTKVYSITKAPLIITTEGATKVYDGEPLTEAKMTIKGLKNNEEVGHKTTGSQTVVGSSDNTYKLDWKEGTVKQGNYEIVKEQLGQLVVTETKDEIVVTTVGGEFTYDGKAHGASVTVEGLPKGYEVKTKKSNATATNVKDGTVKATADELVIVNKNGEDVTSKLTIKKVDGTIKINPAPVTVTTAGDEKVYDGTALTADGSITGLVNGEDKKVDFKVTGSQTEVGSSENSYTLDWKDVDSKNYNLKKNLGTLKVTEQSIDPGTEEEPNPSYKGITINDPKDKEYDGKKHQWSPTVKDASGNELTEGTDYEVSYDTNDFVDVKTIKVTITGKGNYAGTVTKVYSITKAPLIITTEGATKVYDGEPLTEAKMTIKGLKNNEEVGHKTTGSQTVVGSSDNTYKLDWKEGTAKQGNYEIVKEQLGQLVVTETKDEIVVTTVGGEFTYDGKAHGASVTVEGLPKGYEVKTKKSNATATNVKDGTVKATADELVIVNKNGEDVTSKLTIKKVDGTIKINPAPVTVTTAGDEKVYDGEALTAGGSITGLVNGEDKKVDFKVTGSQTAVGNSENNYTLDWKDVDSKNYDLKENLGTLEVTPQSINPGPNPENPDPSYDGIQIDSPSDVEYDGLAHKWSPTVTDKNGNALTEGTDYEVSYDKKDFTDVKTITVTITGKGNYTGTVTRVYNILAAPLIIRTEKAEKTYDGKPLTNENMTIEGLKNGEVVVHKTTGSQTEVGNSDNTYELDWKSKETTAKESNYIIKEVSLGKLVVKETEDEIVVTTTGGTFTYDGQPHGATVEVSELPEGYTLQTAESDATATDVTTEAVTADADRLVIVNAAGVDVTANLKITRVTGEIVVNPATVTVTTPNASKVYDGTPLTAAGTITGLVNGETVSFATTGTITNVGTATNSYSLVWDQTAKETNYTVSENLGTLTVTAPTNNNPSVTPTPPATPNPPATPSDNPGVLDRVVDTIKDVAADVQEVFSSDDGDVPLANQNLDEHKCCILHFLIMLLTAILYGFFTHNMKKRQKKNFELREELDTELVKRGLPTSKEQKNS